MDAPLPNEVDAFKIVGPPGMELLLAAPPQLLCTGLELLLIELGLPAAACGPPPADEDPCPPTGRMMVMGPE